VAKAPAKGAAAARGLPDAQLSPLSVSRAKAGDMHLARGESQAATDAYEAALAADPRNRRAYMGLARAAELEGLPGKAVRFYREALEIDPNDPAALELQGVALIARGATARAEANLERLKTVCAAPCPSADRLKAAIAKGPPAAERTAALDTKPAPAATTPAPSKN
jgi:Tfp pilus assembly protein PilF